MKGGYLVEAIFVIYVAFLLLIYFTAISYFIYIKVYGIFILQQEDRSGVQKH